MEKETKETKERELVIPDNLAPGTLVIGDNYNPHSDIQPVDQFGFVDLREAYVNGAIPGELAADVESYNGVDDPASLLHRATDTFDAIRKANAVQAAGLTEGSSATSEAAAE